MRLSKQLKCLKLDKQFYMLTEYLVVDLKSFANIVIWSGYPSYIIEKII